MNPKRKIVVVTSSRADYWLLRPLIFLINLKEDLVLCVSGEHLVGSGIEKIRMDNFQVQGQIECLALDDSYVGMTQAIGRGIIDFCGFLSTHNPDFVVLLGDRYEIFAAASAAYSLRLPIAHLHGGEITNGALDNGYRHAISKMSTLHFVSHQDYKNRLLRMGESPDRVYMFGAIGLDQLKEVDLSKNDAFFSRYNFLKNKKYILLTLHSSTLSNEKPEMQVDAIKKALAELKDYDVLITQSNQDPGGKYINKKFLEWAKKEASVHFVDALGDDYLLAVYHSTIVIGNSSSGILEVPYLNRPVINLGERQAGRVQPKGVYNCNFDSNEIGKAVKHVMNNYTESEKIYGDPGSVSQMILDVLSSIPLTDITHKRFYDAK